MKVRVKASDDLDRLADRVVREAPRALRASLTVEVDRVGRGARAEWPVRTGRSRNALRWGVRGSDETFEAFVENDEEYADDIRGGDTWQDLVVRRLRAAMDRWVRGVGRIVQGVAR